MIFVVFFCVACVVLGAIACRMVDMAEGAEELWGSRFEGHAQELGNSSSFNEIHFDA